MDSGIKISVILILVNLLAPPAHALGGIKSSLPKSKVPETVEPRIYTLAEAMDAAFNKSFESRLEYENVIQAKQRAKAAHLSLLPHLGVGTVINAITPSVTGYIASIGDLAPFLLPSRWFLAKQGTAQYEAEKVTLKIMRADLGATVEQFAYALQRDKEIADLFEKVREQTLPILKRVKYLDENKLGTPPQSAKHLESIINYLDTDLIAIAQLL